MAKDLAERLHHADDLEWMSRNLHFLVEGVLVRKECPDYVLPKHAYVGAIFNVQIGDVAPIANIVRKCIFVIRRDAQQNGCIALLVLVADSLGNLSIEGRHADD